MPDQFTGARASVSLGVVRNGREDTLTVVLGEMPKERQARAG